MTVAHIKSSCVSRQILHKVANCRSADGLHRHAPLREPLFQCLPILTISSEIRGHCSSSRRQRENLRAEL